MLEHQKSRSKSVAKMLANASAITEMRCESISQVSMGLILLRV
jgi:hypothetical protein